jgi:mannose-6-phosphate isomerase-like protein (cupin superfamily)
VVVCERGRMAGINVADKLRQITELWSPKTVATINDYDVRLARVKGEFVRHRHVASDEFFLVLDGELTIRMDGGDVTLGAGEMYVVPRGVHHQPVAAAEASILLFEPSATVNTGDAGGDLTAPRAIL